MCCLGVRSRDTTLCDLSPKLSKRQMMSLIILYVEIVSVHHPWSVCLHCADPTCDGIDGLSGRRYYKSYRYFVTLIQYAT